LQKLADGAEVKKFAGHNDWVYSVAVHPDTKRIATGCHDGEVRVWNLEDGALVRSFFAAPGYAAPVAAANP
jgi:WD40 repeat protein